MKKIITLAFYAMVGIGMLSFTSCSKEEPETIKGITGANGANGKNGADGAAGLPGEQGLPGNTTLKSSTVSVKEWIYDEITKQYIGFTINNDITQDVLENGFVQVFLKTTDGRYMALPATFYPSANCSFKTGFSLMLQQLRIELQYPDLQKGPMPTALTFKIVAMGKAFTASHKNINFSDYTQLAPYLSSSEK